MPTLLITGGHGGIGLVCAGHIAASAKLDLVLAGRSAGTMEEIARRLRQAHRVRVATLELDVASLESVRDAAARCRRMLDCGDIDALQAIVCNAGARFRSASCSVDGYEQTFATNCLGHFLLVNLLIDRVAEGGRIVFTASGTHDPDTADGRMVGAALEPDAFALAGEGKDGARPNSAGRLYSTSKLCNILNAYELHRRLRKAGSSLASIAFDPGLTTGTGFLRNMPAPVQWLAATPVLPWMARRLGVTIGSAEFSGKALGRIAADAAFGDGSGKYFQSKDGHLIEAQSSRMSYDEGRARVLWQDMKQLAHLRPEEESALLQ